MDVWKHGANHGGNTGSRWMETIGTMCGTGGWSSLLMGTRKKKKGRGSQGREWIPRKTVTVTSQRRPGRTSSTSFVYHHIILCPFGWIHLYHCITLSPQSVGAMLWSVVQLRRGRVRMVFYVVGSCWCCDQLSALARHTHMLHCPQVPNSLQMICSDRPQFVLCLESASVLYTYPLTPSSGSDAWHFTRVGPDASHSCFQAAAIHASLDRSSVMALSISSASLLKDWRDASLHGGTSFFVVSCWMCQSCFTAFLAWEERQRCCTGNCWHVNICDRIINRAATTW